MAKVGKLRKFVQSFTQLIDDHSNDEEQVFSDGQVLLLDLIEQDDWLPDEFAKANPQRYQQNLLYCDPKERFSVVSFVWGPGQATPVHDHTVWGMIGMLRGVEFCEEFDVDLESGLLIAAQKHEVAPGEIDLVSPRVGDIHRVSNALPDSASISIHVYGANIGAIGRHTYEIDTGSKRTFISGYSSQVIPNIWDRSVEHVAAG